MITEKFQTIEVNLNSPVTQIHLNRPEVHNCVNDQMMAELEALLDHIEGDEAIRSIVLSGAGEKTFCAGGDLKYFATLQMPAQVEAMSERMQGLLSRLYSGRRPVIAAINGQALGGGCEILSACHIRIAVSTASFAFRQVPNGIITGWGGGARFLGQVGSSRALSLFLRGERFSVQDAQAMGWISEIVGEKPVVDVALEIATDIAQHDAEAIAAMLKMAREEDPGIQQSLADLERKLFVNCWQGERFQAILRKYSG